MVQIPLQQLKDSLVKEGLITAEEFDKTADEAGRMGQSVPEALIARNIITREYYYNALSKFFGVELAKLATRQIDETALRLIPEDLARQKRVVIFAKEADGTLDVAMEDPTDLATIDFLTSRLKMKIRPFLATTEDLNRGFTLYGRRSAEEFKKLIEENVQASLRGEVFGKTGKEAAQELPVVEIVNNLMSYAIASRASDIHIEVLEDAVLVRFRIDGVLHEITKIPKAVHDAIIARLKLLSSLRLDEHSKPQDGRFRYQ